MALASDAGPKPSPDLTGKPGGGLDRQNPEAGCGKGKAEVFKPMA